MAEEDVVEKKEGTERRVYNLPGNLLARLRAYQVSQAISSEAEAARRLLDYALQMRDNVQNILRTLDARFAEERDLRVLAGDILTKHMLVTQVTFDEDSVIFTLRNRERGRMNTQGAIFFQNPDDGDDYWREVNKVKGRLPATADWDSGPRGGDIDDEIPF
jgi:hypothetical protein